jgi:L-rhamnose mutarotase
MRVGLRTRLREGAAIEYEELHRAVPGELLDALRDVGVTDWVIFRDGLDLFHCITVDDYDAAIAALAELPVNQRWQERMSQFTEVAHDYSGSGSDRMTLVFDLTW